MLVTAPCRRGGTGERHLFSRRLTIPTNATISQLHTIETAARQVLQLIVDAKSSLHDGDDGSARMYLEQVIEDCGDLAKRVDEVMAEM